MKRAHSIRSYLLVFFGLGVLLPFLLLGVAGFYAVGTISRAQSEEKLATILRATAGRAASFLEEVDRALREAGSLIEWNLVEGGEIPLLLDSLRGSYRALETVLVLDAEGRVVAISPDDKDFVGIDLSRQAFYRSATISGRWSDAFLSLRTGRSVVSVDVRIGQRSVVGILDLERLSEFVAGVTLGKGGEALIADSRGTIIAARERERVRQRDNFPFPELRAATRGATPMFGVFRAEDRAYRASALRLEGPGWIVALYQPLAEADALVRLVIAGFVTALVIALGAMAAFVCGLRRRVLAPFAGLSRAAARVSAGEYAYAAPEVTGLSELDGLARAFVDMGAAVAAREAAMRAAEDRLTESLAQKDVLLREIHHRVKNNLQIVASILALQADAVRGEAAETAFLECQARVQAMAAVHERLYLSEDIARVPAREYFETLLVMAFQADPDKLARISWTIEADDSTLDIDRAVPSGLIVAEAVSNALKHAFPAGRAGAIRLAFGRSGEGYALSVRDDGVGPGRGFEERRPNSLGLELIAALASQLKARTRIGAAPGGGFEVALDFPAGDGT